MSRVPLSDEETNVVFTETARETLGGLNADDQKAILSRLLDIVTSSALPSSFVRERIANLDIIAVSDQCRLYTKVVEEIPEGDTEYHVVFLFYIDVTHDYPHSALATYSRSAEQFVEHVTSLDGVDDVEAYLEANDALGAAELRALRAD